MKRFVLAALLVASAAAVWLASPRALEACGFRKVQRCQRCQRAAAQPVYYPEAPPCPITGAWVRTLWTTPYYPTCNPLFNSGRPLSPEPPQIETVIRLTPISSIPKEPPPTRPISSEAQRRMRLLEDPPPRPEDEMPGQPAQQSTGRLYLALLVDSDAAEMGKIFTAGADIFERLLRAGIRPERIATAIRIGTPDLTIETISQKFKDLPIKADDTFVVYYAGPAEYEEATTSFVLTPGAARISRDLLRKQATDKGARLTVFLSDPASNPAIARPAAKVDEPDPGRGGLERLFFGYSGLVDVHGCSSGEFAATRGEYGGCFTLAFVREFGRPAGTWADLLEGVKFTTNNMYKAYRLEVLRADDQPAPIKNIYRNQESQIPATLTPIDNLKAPNTGTALPNLIPYVTLMPTRPIQPAPAYVRIRVPEAARVWIDGRPTTQIGGERLFETPPLEVEQVHVYEIRVELGTWAGVYRLGVSAGQTTAADLQVPAEVKGN